MSNLTLNGVELVMTCGACPEQYDAFIDGKRVAYLRLRHGYFYASCPWVEGEVVYETETEGDGIFASEEREKHLTAAVEAIKAWMNSNKCRVCQKRIPSGCVLCDSCPSDDQPDAIHDGG